MKRFKELFIGLVWFMVPVVSIGQITFGEMTDPRDYKRYKTVTIRKEVGLGVIYTHTWMAENLNYEMNGSYCYVTEEQGGKSKKTTRVNHCDEYGRLYTWETAKKVCPEGWHLPTDVEWQRLIHQFAPSGLIDDQTKLKLYTALVEDGASGFSAQLGGFRYSAGNYEDLGRSGYYWSSTERNKENALHYYFKDRELNRNDSMKTGNRSVRCIQDN